MNQASLSWADKKNASRTLADNVCRLEWRTLLCKLDDEQYAALPAGATFFQSAVIDIDRIKAYATWRIRATGVLSEGEHDRRLPWCQYSTRANTFCNLESRDSVSHIRGIV